ncbi:Nuclear transport factor 2 [Cardamine amara subsp. amara]|uniref:Nuclear transport factor 2 n=1 Tax=Cardamine amara subsp. amara TaxID=228776 RepID=A0ABD1BSV6_CARAN
MTTESNVVDPNIVGNAFVQKYYNHLYESPAEVHKFYLEDSLIMRPGLNGESVSFKSLKAINDHLMSVDYKNSKIQILHADSQPSFKNGVATLVIGLVIGENGGRKKFSQCFFLVPHKGSYFVLNDALRYVSDESVEPEATKVVEESPQEIIIAEPAKEIVEAVIVPTTVTKPESAVANGHAKVPEEKVVNGNRNLPKAAEEKLQENAPKKSFAVIVAQYGGSSYVNASPAKPKRVEKPSVAPKPKAPAPVPIQGSAKTIEQPAKGGSIFVANLPMDATIEELYETFIDFGAIKKDGIQVRSNMETRNCFGFVAFENAEAIKSVFQAHKESPIYIGDRRASIEEKRGKSNENGNRPYGRNNGGYQRNENGYKNDGYRSRGSGGRGDGRRNSEARGDGKTHQKNGHANAQAKN